MTKVGCPRDLAKNVTLELWMSKVKRDHILGGKNAHLKTWRCKVAWCLNKPICLELWVMKLEE